MIAPDSLRRQRALLRKEWLLILRDPSSFAIAFLLPAILLFLFGYGVSLDPQRVPVAFVEPAHDVATGELRAAFAGSPWFELVVVRDFATARELLDRGRVQGIVRLRADFAERLAHGDAPVQVILDGVDANTARIVQGYVRGVFTLWLARQAPPGGFAGLLRPEPRIWFNEEVDSRHFLIPGLVAIVMTLIGALLTALVVARECEHGTFEALFATPVRRREILIGKLLPYFVLGVGGMVATVAVAILLFGVPWRGSFAALALVSGLYMLVALSFGLLVSGAARDQFVAAQVTLFAAFLPAFMLSGFLFDIRSMPVVLQWLTLIVPARWFVSSLQTLFLAGDVWSVVLRDAGVLAVMAAILAALARGRLRKSLE